MTREDYIKFLFLKRKKKNFFYLMENYKILYYMKGSLVSYGFSIICLIVSVILFFIEINNQKMNNQLIIALSFLIAFMCIGMLISYGYIFLKNSLQFKLGKLSSGLKSFIFLILPVYLILILCYIVVPKGKEFVSDLLVAVTTFAGATLAVMGVHYTFVQQRNERIDKNKLIFELYEKSESENIIKIKNSFGDKKLNIKIKNLSNNFGFVVGLYKLCGLNIYQIGDDISYLAIQPNACMRLDDVFISNGDDQLLLVYKDIGENYYYLLLIINGDKVSCIEKAGKCDLDFVKNQLYVTEEMEKKSKKNKKNLIKKELTSKYDEIDISKRKEITKPKKTLRHEGFDLIVDSDGEIITDLNLLKILKEVRLKLAREMKIKTYLIFTNQQLVALATYKPENETNFISIYGLGKKKYDMYGDRIIQIIENYKQ